MTVIAYKDGVMAGDSRSTIETESGGIRMSKCEKMYRKILPSGDEVIIGVAGEGFPALVFVDWIGSGKEPPELLIHGDADFSAIVLTKEGLFEYDKWCRHEKVIDSIYAIGCGAKGALTAMHCGASAARAVEATCLVDPLCGPPVVTMRLKPTAKRSRKPKGSKGVQVHELPALMIEGSL
jgi:hypothetical protein